MKLCLDTYRKNLLHERYITPTEMKGFMFCSRFSYYQNYLGIKQNAHKRYKVRKGNEKHESKEVRNKNITRIKINGKLVKKNFEVSDPEFKIRGIIDEVYQTVESDDKEKNKIVLIPLDYKFAEYKEIEFKTYRFQMGMYAMMLEKTCEIPVKEYALVFTRSNDRLEKYAFNKKLKLEILKGIAEYRRVLKGYYPEGTEHKRKCDDCCYRKICIQ